MRHADAVAAEAGMPDVDRPLSERGQRDAARMGGWLRQQGLAPDLVLTSSARRAADTASAVIEAGGIDGELVRQPALYAAELDVFFEAIQAVPDGCATLLVVAHNPGTEALVLALTGTARTLPMGALAHLTLPIDHWPRLDHDVAGRLVQVARPGDLA